MDTLSLDNMLHILGATYNLIFVNKICTDHDISIEFDSSGLCVKDMVSKKVKLKGPSSHGFMGQGYGIWEGEEFCAL